MFPLPQVPKPRSVTQESSTSNITKKGSSGENILGTPHKITRSRSQDLRKVLLTASLSSSCPDLLEDKQNLGARLTRRQSRTESCDLLTSRLGGATQRLRALGIGLQRNSPRASTEGSSRASPSLSKMNQVSTGNSTPVSSRRAAANSSSKDSPMTEEHGSYHSNSKVDAMTRALGDRRESNGSHCEMNGHVKLQRTNARTNTSASDGNSRCSSAIMKSDKSEVSNVNVLKLTKENLTETIKVVSDKNNKEGMRIKIDSKKEKNSFLKNLFGFKKRAFICNRECNSTPDGVKDDIPDTMTRAQYERCCQWLEEVETAKNNRCIEVSACPPPIWSE